MGFVAMDDLQRRDNIADLFRKQKIGGGQYTLTLPQEFGIMRQLEFPSEIRDKLKSAVALQVETLSPWNLDRSLLGLLSSNLLGMASDGNW